MQKIRQQLARMDGYSTVAIYGGLAALTVYVYQGHWSVYQERFAGPLADQPLGQWHGQLYQIGVAFSLLFLLPLAWILVKGKLNLAGCGLQLGDWRFGLKALALGMALLAVPLWINAGSPAFQAEYPLVRMAGDSWRLFLLWQLCYAVYYVAWEFFFRGFWQLGLSARLGVAGAMALQTSASTLMHIGKPEGETMAAIAAGVAFGLLAWRTRSVLYVFLLHWYVGMMTDLFCILRAG